MSVRKAKGFTLIELLIVIALIAVLAAAVIIALNPARLFSQARNSERWSHVTTLSTAIQQDIAEHRGTFSCGFVPSTSTLAISNTGFDLCDCLTPTYIAALPLDPSSGSFVSCAEYDTGYTITRNASTSRLTIDAPAAELEASISISR